MTSAERADVAYICPGWEECSGRYEECTLSRCCSDEGFGCFLNRTSQALGVPRAECRPQHLNVSAGTRPLERVVNGVQGAAGNGNDEDEDLPQVVQWASESGHGMADTHEAPYGAGHDVGRDAGARDGASTSSSSAHQSSAGCSSGGGGGGSGETGVWICSEDWMAWRDVLFKAPVHVLRKHLSADMIALIALLSTFAACLVVGCTCAHRRKMQAGVRRLEEELSRRKVAHEIELARVRGEGEAASLRDFQTFQVE